MLPICYSRRCLLRYPLALRKPLGVKSFWSRRGNNFSCSPSIICTSARSHFSESRPAHSASSGWMQGSRRLLFSHEQPNFSSHSPPGDAAEEFVYDPMEGVQRDVAVETAKKSVDAVLRELLPPHAPSEAFAKAQKYLLEHPINELIMSTNIQITHITNTEGEEVKVTGAGGSSSCDRDAALRQAREKGLDLVLMGRKGDTAYCRIRNEKDHILQLVKKELDAAAAVESSGRPTKIKELIQHQFRDVVDAHFIGWKSKKIVQDIKKGHPVKLVIREFQNWEGSILKLREMCKAVERAAETDKVSHHFCSITANANEVSIMLSPSVNRSGSGNKGVQIKHPIEKEWANAKKRMEDSCRKSGRFGTYMKAPQLKPRCLGETTYRVDKYGRRIE